MILVVCGPPAEQSSPEARLAPLDSPPGVGKTAVATRLQARLAARGEGFGVLHSDDFRRRTYERLYERVAAAPDRNWILDGTFYDRTWQERFRALGGGERAAPGGVRFVRLRASLDTCLRRNAARENPIDERGVRAMYHRFADPRADLELDTDELGPAEAVERILAAMDDWRDGS